MPDSLTREPEAGLLPFAPLPAEASLVSVLVRTRDRAVLLRRALASIAAQTLPPREVVVVNDGGDPGPVQAALHAAWPDGATAPVLRPLHLPSPRGRWPAARAALAAATGPLVALLDDDDSWEAEFLDAVTARFRAPDGDRLAAAFTHCAAVEERMADPDDLPQPLSRSLIRPPHDGFLAIETLMRPWNFQPCAALYRREALERAGAWDDRLTIGGDWEMHLRLALEGEIAVVPRALANWHRRLHLGPGGSPLANATNDQDAYAALHAQHRAALLRLALRRQPWLAGPLLLAAHEAEEAAARDAALAARIAALETRLVELERHPGPTRAALERLAETMARMDVDFAPVHLMLARLEVLNRWISWVAAPLRPMRRLARRLRGTGSRG